MRLRARQAGLAAALTMLLAAAPASAETFNKTYGGGEPDTFAWEGEVTGLPSFSVGVTGLKNGCFDFATLFRCDLVIFNVKEAGELEASTTMDDAPTCDPVDFHCTVDIDIYLYKSDAAGEHDSEAEPIASGATVEQTETLKAKVQPGYYVLEVEPYNGQNVTYKGTSKFISANPPAPPVAPPTPETPAPPPPPPAPEPAPQTAPQTAAQPAPAAKPKKTGKRAACQKKAKKIKKAKKRKKALKACKRKPA